MSQKDAILGENEQLFDGIYPKHEKPGLFDRDKLSRMPQGSQGGGALVPLEQLSLHALLDLRAQIDERLPARSLGEIDLEEELLLQFARTKSLFEAVVEDDKTPANQRAQVANSCSAILEQLVKMEAKLYSSERVKALEQVLVRALKTLPEAQQVAFFERYERALDELGLAKSAPTLTPPPSTTPPSTPPSTPTSGAPS
jgi:hypothetical protein